MSLGKHFPSRVKLQGWAQISFIPSSAKHQMPQLPVPDSIKCAVLYTHGLQAEQGEKATCILINNVIPYSPQLCLWHSKLHLLISCKHFQDTIWEAWSLFSFTSSQLDLVKMTDWNDCFKFSLAFVCPSDTNIKRGRCASQMKRYNLNWARRSAIIIIT